MAVGSGVLNEVSPLDRHALSKFTLAASVPSCAPLGNDCRAVVPCHAPVKSEQFLMFVVLKSLSDEQPYHVRYVLVAEGSSVLKLVSDVQALHASRTLFAVGNGVLNDNKPLPRHASKKFTLFASVPSFAPAGNDVRAAQFFHASSNVTPFGACIAPKEFNELQSCQLDLNRVPALKSVVLNSIKSLSLHDFSKLVPVGNGVLNDNKPLPRHASKKFTLFASVPSFAPAGNDVRA